MEAADRPSNYRSFESARWMVEFYHQWDSFLPRVNWRDFTLVCIEGEWNHSWPLVEFRVVILGLGFRVVRQLDVDEDDAVTLSICSCHGVGVCPNYRPAAPNDGGERDG